jgi:excisionase family DNA binding protein
MSDCSTVGHDITETADRGCIAGPTRSARINPAPVPPFNRDSLPLLLTPREAASILRITPKAIYAMIDRAQLPGVIRMGRRLRIDTRVLLHWLDRKCAAPSPKE